jgi:toxin ParE1/3/4
VTPKDVVLRPIARQDIDEAIAHYLGEDETQAALGFIGELEKAYAHISRQPGSGSPRDAHELNSPGLRFWQLSRFPYLVFYFERAEAVDVWRVLHAQRDIPEWMSEP